MMNTASIGMAVTPTVVSTLFSHYLNRKPLRQRPTAHLSYDEGLHLIRAFLDYASKHRVEDLQAFTAQWVPHPHWVKVEDVTIPDAALSEAASLLQAQLGHDGIRQVGGRNWWQWREPGRRLHAEWIEMRADYKARTQRPKAAGPQGRTTPSDGRHLEEDDERATTDAAPASATATTTATATATGNNRVMLYVHGGAYFFGSVDEHRYQMQRHARKLKARVLAPRYRLAPQFPFPCGLQDCLAAYLYLVRHARLDPRTVVLAGDSAGAGMIVSLLVVLRDQGLPLPAGAVLISPWVDLTHSFPSVAGECPLDYIPQAGFHHRPSEAWPPPDEAELEELKKAALRQKAQYEQKSHHQSSASPESSNASCDVPTTEDVARKTHRLTVPIDGATVQITEQIQLYTTNELISHPLVSPVMQPTLGGLPPLLIMVGGGEILRDEQIYLAHKCANPAKYRPPEDTLDAAARERIDRYPPTDVQLQVWDDLCHVATTLSFTRPAKYMYRSVSQFAAWCLARAQQEEIDIPYDDDISVISRSSSDTEDVTDPAVDAKSATTAAATASAASAAADDQFVGKAGDPLPPFRNHMIRQRVTRHGVVLPLPPASQLPGCNMDRELVGRVKPGPVHKWLQRKRAWEARFERERARVRAKRLRDAVAGYETFGSGEVPPPTALAGRRRRVAAAAEEETDEKRRRRRGKSVLLAMWALWGSKHDEKTVERERLAEKEVEHAVAVPLGGRGGDGAGDGGSGAPEDGDRDATRTVVRPARGPVASRSRSRSRVVRDENQTGDTRPWYDSKELPSTPVSVTPAAGEPSPHQGLDAAAPSDATTTTTTTTHLSPSSAAVTTGVTGKRPKINGIAMPFSLKKEADTASMITLDSARMVPSRQTTQTAPGDGA